MADPGRIRELVTGAGFGEPEIEQVEIAWPYADVDDHWNFTMKLAGPLADKIRTLDEDEREAVRSAVRSEIEPLLADGGSATGRVHVVRVQVPGRDDLLDLRDGLADHAQADLFGFGLLLNGDQFLGIHDPHDVFPVVVQPVLAELVADGRHQLVGQQAQVQMGFRVAIFLVVNGPQVQIRFQGAKGGFHVPDGIVDGPELGLDDRVGDYIDGWGNGKERCTIRHVLTHTGGFPNADAKLFDHDVNLLVNAIKRTGAK